MLRGHRVGRRFDIRLHGPTIMLENPFLLDSLERLGFASVAFVLALGQRWT